MSDDKEYADQNELRFWEEIYHSTLATYIQRHVGSVANENAERKANQAVLDRASFIRKQKLR